MGCFYEEQSTYDVETHRDVSDERLKDCLRKLGYEDFRSGQLDAQKWMHSTCADTPKNYLFFVSPTGSGKSLLWELFPLVNERKRKTAVVVSSTISLSLACAAKAQERYPSCSLDVDVFIEYLRGHERKPSLYFYRCHLFRGSMNLYVKILALHAYLLTSFSSLSLILIFVVMIGME